MLCLCNVRHKTTTFGFAVSPQRHKCTFLVSVCISTSLYVFCECLFYGYFCVLCNAISWLQMLLGRNYISHDTTQNLLCLVEFTKHCNNVMMFDLEIKPLVTIPTGEF